MELSDYISVLRKNVVLLVTLALVGAGTGALFSLLRDPVYEAETQVFVSAQAGDSSAELVQGNSFTLSRVKTYARLATSREVLDRVRQTLGSDVSDRELESVTASPLVDTTIIAISAASEEAASAALVADAVASALAETVAEIESSAEMPSPVRLTTVERASVPVSPSSPRSTLNIAVGTLVGLVLALGIAVLRQLLDTRIRTEREANEISQLPVVGAIALDPKARQRPLIVQAEPLNPRSEAFRTLRTNLQFVEVDDAQRAFVITSSLPGEGKSTTAANLALAFADAGETVILIDADLRKPRMAEYMGVDGGVGLTDVLIGRAELADAVQLWGDSSLYLLPSGRVPPNPSELLGSKSMQGLIEQLGTEFDWVLFDSPPLLPVTDAALLARHTSGAIVVAASGRTTRHQLEDALQMLRNVDAPIAGIAMTMMPLDSGAYGYGYGYGEAVEYRNGRRSKRPRGIRRVF